MRGILPNTVLLGFITGLALAFSSAQTQVQTQNGTQSPPAPATAASAAQAQMPAPSAGVQQLSQAGARGQLHAAVVPPVPVPPGPVAPAQIKPAPPTPIAVKKVELQEDDPWSPEWDVFIEENLPPELLSRHVAGDVKSFCPRFNLLTDADKRSFWAYFFQALAGAEAGLRPTADVRHSQPSVAVMDPVTHHVSRQEGLLQLKYQDSVRYGCGFDWQLDKYLPERDPDKTILNPHNNLLCGIRILRNQLVDLHQPLLTRKSYWATLRPGTPGYRNFVRQMANVPEACGQRTVHHRRRLEWPLDDALFSQPSTSQTPAVSSFRSQP